MPTSPMHGEFNPRVIVPAFQECPLCRDIYQGAHSCQEDTEDRLGTVVPMQSATDALGMAILRAAGQLGEKADIEQELDGVAQAIRLFHVKQPDQVMRECAAYSARLTELCVLLHRVESLDRQYLKVRTQQVERFLKECDTQFRIASRLVEVMRQDLALER